jgi:hypothetical protein
VPPNEFYTAEDFQAFMMTPEKEKLFILREMISVLRAIHMSLLEIKSDIQYGQIAVIAQSTEAPAGSRDQAEGSSEESTGGDEPADRSGDAGKPQRARGPSDGTNSRTGRSPGKHRNQR